MFDDKELKVISEAVYSQMRGIDRDYLDRRGRGAFDEDYTKWHKESMEYHKSLVKKIDDQKPSSSGLFKSYAATCNHGQESITMHNNGGETCEFVMFFGDFAEARFTADELRNFITKATNLLQ